MLIAAVALAASVASTTPQHRFYSFLLFELAVGLYCTSPPSLSLVFRQLSLYRPYHRYAPQRNGTRRSARNHLLIIPSPDESPRHARSRFGYGRQENVDLYYLLSLARGG